MKALSPSVDVYLWQGECDMRMSFDRLSSLIGERLGRSAMSCVGDVSLPHEGDVAVLGWGWIYTVHLLFWHKRLEAGSYKVARVEESTQVTAIDLEELLRGTELSRILLRKSAENGSFAAR